MTDVTLSVYQIISLSVLFLVIELKLYKGRPPLLIYSIAGVLGSFLESVSKISIESVFFAGLIFSSVYCLAPCFNTECEKDV